MRSAENVYKEVMDIYEKYGANIFTLQMIPLLPQKRDVWNFVKC